MRLAASTVAFPGVPFLGLAEAASGVGVAGLAITVSENGSLPPAASDAEIAELKARCGDRGVRISAIYGYAGRGVLKSTTERTADLDLAKRCVDLAARLDAPVSRLFAWKEPPASSLIDRFVEACGPLADHAASAGIVLGIPTHHDLAFDPISCRRLINGFGRGRAGIIFNGPSMELDGIRPLSALRDMKDLIEQVELKDWRRRGAGEAPTSIGAGEATVWPLVEALVDMDFRGWTTLHHLKQHHPELPDLVPGISAAIRKIVDRRRPSMTYCSCGQDSMLAAHIAGRGS